MKDQDVYRPLKQMRNDWYPCLSKKETKLRHHLATRGSYRPGAMQVSNALLESR